MPYFVTSEGETGKIERHSFFKGSTSMLGAIPLNNG